MNVLQGLQRGTILLPPAIEGFTRVARGEPVYIPPRSVATVRDTGIGNRKQGLQPTEVLVEGLRDGHHKGIMVASTLSSVHGSSFFTQVLNISDKGVVLRPGTTIGTVQLTQREVAAPGHVSVEASCNRIHVSTNPSPIPMPRERPCPVDLEGAECTASERHRLEGLVKANANMFFQDDQDLGYTDRVSHQMRMQDDIPVASHFRRIPPTQIQEVKEHIQMLLDKKIVRKSCNLLDEGIDISVKNSLETIIKQVHLEGGFKRGGRIRVAECLRQIVPNRWACIRKIFHQMFFCLHDGWQRFMCRMRIVIVLLEFKVEGDQADTEGLFQRWNWSR